MAHASLVSLVLKIMGKQSCFRFGSGGRNRIVDKNTSY
jgi:hypothetical protein